MEANLYYALPEPFDPLTTNLDFDQWVRKFKACAVANQWQEADQLRHLPPLLRGDAWILYDELSADEKDTMDHLASNLSRDFPDRDVPAEDQRYLQSEQVLYHHLVQQDDGNIQEREVAGAASAPPTWLPAVINAISKANRVCDYCKKPGHLESDCYKKQRDEGRRLRPQKRSRLEDRPEYPRTPGAICTYCAKKNHTAEQCQIKKNAEALAKKMKSGN
ncbi:paraneoplastic Ma antigen [Perkinsus olseni]|uniref:Paraneoplastic Ma antigen n=1 Tax=Perkinsus olseni TaxID=32597 RepID=A0A7J6T459_PEROL|nr:paraneoplastic Ma antigen [Perkinsus olseni]